MNNKKCHDKQYNSDSGLDISTWTTPNVTDHTDIECTVTPAKPLHHLVSIRNLKTYSRRIYIKSELQDPPNSAKFDGPASLIKTDREWEATRELLGHSGADTTVFDQVMILGRAPGNDVVKVDVQYSDSWNPDMKKNGSNSQRPLGFSINVR